MVTKISDFLNTTFSTLTVDDALNTAVSYPGALVHTTTNTPAAGIGVGLRFQTETSANNNEIGLTLEAVTTDVTATSEDFDFVVKLMQNGAAVAERFRVTSAGAASASAFIPTGSTIPANGVYLPTTNTVSISTASTERLRIDANGNLGLGVTPSAWSWGGRVIDGTNNMVVSAGGNYLSVAANVFWNGSAWAHKTTSQATRYDQNAGSHSWHTAPSGTAGGTVSFTQAMTLATDGNLAVGTTTTTQAKVNIQGVAGANTVGELYMTDGTQWTRMATNLVAGAYNNIVSANDHAIIFSNGTTGTGAFAIAPWASATSGMRMDASGNISVKLASVTAGYTLDVGGSVRVAGGIVATGEITAYFSDARLKSNITAITNAVDKVMAINGVYYNANDLAVEIAGEDKTVQRVGLLAQEVEAVLPQVVKAAPFDISDYGISKSGENYKTLQYERVVPLLVEAIKEQQQQIDQLTKRVEQLENKSST